MIVQPWLFSAIAFGSPANLWWGLVAAVPILLHLWNHRTRPAIAWAAMRLLQEAESTVPRRMRLRDLLLLATRIAMVLLLAGAVADPLITASGGWVSGAKRHHVLILDNSFSMERQRPGGSSLEWLKRAARAFVEQARGDQAITLMTMDGQTLACRTDVTGDLARLRRAIDEVGVSDQVARVGPALDALDRLGGQGPGPTDVVFFSDLAANTWHTAADPSSATAQLLARRRERFALLDCHVAIDNNQTDNNQTDNNPTNNNPTNGDPTDNVVLASLEPRKRNVSPNETVTFEATVENQAPTPRQIFVELLVDGKLSDRASLTLPGRARHGDAVVIRAGRWRPPGSRSRVARLAAVRQPAVSGVSCQASDQGALPGPTIGRRPQLRLALEPSSDQSWIRSTVASTRYLNEAELQDYDVVFLCNVGGLSESARSAHCISLASVAAGLSVFWAISFNETRGRRLTVC